MNCRKLSCQWSRSTFQVSAPDSRTSARSSGDKKAEADARSGLSDLFDFERIEALAQDRLALAIYRDLGDLQGEATVLRKMGAIYAGAGFSRQASALLPRALEIEKKLGHPEEQAEIHALLGAAFQTEGSFEESIAHFEQALPPVGAGAPMDRVGALLRLANLQYTLGRTEDALPRVEEAVALLQREEPADPAGELQRQMAKLMTVMRDDLHPLEEQPGPELAPLLEDDALFREKLVVFAEELEDICATVSPRPPPYRSLRSRCWNARSGGPPSSGPPFP